MFCVVYEFRIKKGFKEQFLKSWSEFTKAIYRVNNSMGSRIHATKDSEKYIAYAQWSSEEAFNNAASIEKYTDQEQQFRKDMSDATTEIKVLHKLYMIEDQLK